MRLKAIDRVVVVLDNGISYAMVLTEPDPYYNTIWIKLLNHKIISINISNIKGIYNR